MGSIFYYDTMSSKKESIIKKELDAVKDMAVDFLPRLTSLLLNPDTWQSSEHLIASLGNVAAGFVGRRLKKFLEEIWNDKENIDEGVANSEKSNQSFIDLIKFSAQENPDVETWEAAKKIFMRTLQKDVTEQERGSLYDLISICKELSGTEIRILAGAYQILKTPDEPTKNQQQVRGWANEVSENIGLATSEQVLRYEDNLARQELISGRGRVGGTTLDTWNCEGGTQRHRLTPLGRKLVESFTSDFK